MIRIQPEYHRGANPLTIDVERSDEGGHAVWLAIHDEDGAVTNVTLLADEAHALAASLAHFADRAER